MVCGPVLRGKGRLVLDLCGMMICATVTQMQVTLMLPMFPRAQCAVPCVDSGTSWIIAGADIQAALFVYSFIFLACQCRGGGGQVFDTFGGPLAATLPFERFFPRVSQTETSGPGLGPAEARAQGLNLRTL